MKRTPALLGEFFCYGCSKFHKEAAKASATVGGKAVCTLCANRAAKNKKKKPDIWQKKRTAGRYLRDKFLVPG